MVARDYTHASFFSGIGAFDLGLEQAGFRVVSHAEVKPYSCAVLETRWPGVPNLGDINAICPDGEGDHECEIPKADVWTGGFPCSDFSVMGKRKGLLGGNRSSLGLVFLDLVRRHRPPYVILENVPGLLSSHEGRDLGLLLGTLVDIGYGWSFRLLDARNFGLPQARRRVFVVAAADPADAGAVLDDSTYRRVDAPEIGGSRRAVVARGGARVVSGPPVVLGPTLSPFSDAIQRADGASYPILPNNKFYVLDDSGGDEPIVIRREGTFEPQAKRDGSTFTVTPTSGRDRGNIGEQYVIVGDDQHPGPLAVQLPSRKGPIQHRDDGSAYTLLPTEAQYVVDQDREQPLVIRRDGNFEPHFRRDGAAFTVVPGSGDHGQQYVTEHGPGPIVVYPTFSKRDQQRLASRADGATYTLLPGATPFVLEPGDDFGDLDDLWGGGPGVDVLDGRDGGDGPGGGPRADVGTPATAGAHRPSDDGGASGGPSEETDADGVRATAGLPGRLDDPDGELDRYLGPKHLDAARWHVLGRACPVPVVEWMGQALRTVIDLREGRDPRAGEV